MSVFYLIISLFFVNNHLLYLVTSLLAFSFLFIKLLILYLNGLKEKDLFNELLLMIIASVVAFILGEFFEAVIVLVLFSVGELLEDFATDKARKQIGGLAHLKAISVRQITREGVVELSPEEVCVGSLIEIRKGDRVPIDGILLDRGASLDMRGLTGESVTVFTNCGEEILAGAVNVGESFILKTIRQYKDSATEKIIAMVEGLWQKKQKVNVL